MTNRPQLVTVRDLFSGERRFRVPIYQRAYAWGRVEIETLIRDVASVLDRSAYFIGSLVLHKVRDVEGEEHLFDVIDGQQRLTTLFLMLTHPDVRPRLLELTTPLQISDRLLGFEQRTRSNRDLTSLARARPGAPAALHDDGVRSGVEIIGSILSDDLQLRRLLHDQGAAISADDEPTIERVLAYLLDRVHIVMTELPQDTDLNHYFEVMNTRGEQLEKHEIVKAHLLSVIRDDPERRDLFATVWDACSDFSRHIQARFEPGNRSVLFGDPKRDEEAGWSTFLPTSIDEVIGRISATSQAGRQDLDLDSLLAEPPRGPAPDRPVNDDGDAGRYGTIIDFPNFLLHALRLHAGDSVQVSLDDKRLVEQFEHAITSAEDALNFVFRLLRARFLFDNFVIKPLEEPGRSDDSNWVIHRMHYTRSGTGSAKLSPLNTFERQSRRTQQQLLMLQSMYQVTNQRRVYKEFLFQLLKYLDDAWLLDGQIDGQGFIRHIHRMVEADLQAVGAQGHPDVLDAGTGVPHFALNALDYKLWWLSAIEERPPMSLPRIDVSSFRFAYRTSIEHFLPVNLADSQEQLDAVNTFGNLCLMTRTENSRRSDHMPDWKVEKYGHTDQSLKFHYMAEAQQQERKWGPVQIIKQGAAMREVLFTPLPV